MLSCELHSKLFRGRGGNIGDNTWGVLKAHSGGY